MTEAPPAGSRRLGQACAPLLVGLTHFTVAFGSLALTRWSNGLASIWLPNAILLAYLLVSPRARWPAACVAVMISGVSANWLGGAPLLLSIVFGATNVFEPMLVALILQPIGRSVDLERLPDLLRFVLGAALASMLSATGAALAMEQALRVPFDEA